MSTHPPSSEQIDWPLKSVSFDRLACLLRHWTWADEARDAFDRELAQVCDDEDPVADRPFDAYYRWCALLCALSEAALDRALLSDSELDAIHADVEATLPGLRACRQLFVDIPSSYEEHPCLMDLLRDTETLDRLRRLHKAFGDALRQEQLSRQIDSLDH